MIGNHEIDAELPGFVGRFRRTDPAVDGHDHVDAVGVQALDPGRLEAVAVAKPFGNEVHDLTAEQLERPPEDDRGRDAVDVVVAVDRDSLARGDRAFEPLDRARQVRQPGRIVQVVERRMKEAFRLGGIAEAAQAQQPRDDGVDSDRARERFDRRLIADLMLPLQHSSIDFRADAGELA